MADGTAIEWTDATVNFWWGCTKVGPGCDHCYAETFARRYGHQVWGTGVSRRPIKGAAKLILKLQNDYSWFYADNDRRRRVFIQSMSDLFDLEVPIEWFAEAWRLIKLCSDLEIQIVTKRISVVEKRLATIGETSWPQHAGLIISVVNQAEADRDIPRLLSANQGLSIPWVGLSMEPLLGPVNIWPWLCVDDHGNRVNWVVVGGESGPGARPMHPDWARSLHDQCTAAGVSFLFKQWGEYRPSADCAVSCKAHGAVVFDQRSQSFRSAPDDGGWIGDIAMCRVGKKVAGRLLDGVQHDGFPA